MNLLRHEKSFNFSSNFIQNFLLFLIRDTYTDRLFKETEDLESQLKLVQAHIQTQQQKEAEIKFEFQTFLAC